MNESKLLYYNKLIGFNYLINQHGSDFINSVSNLLTGNYISNLENKTIAPIDNIFTSSQRVICHWAIFLYFLIQTLNTKIPIINEEQLTSDINSLKEQLFEYFNVNSIKSMKYHSENIKLLFINFNEMNKDEQRILLTLGKDTESNLLDECRYQRFVKAIKRDLKDELKNEIITEIKEYVDERINELEFKILSVETKLDSFIQYVHQSEQQQQQQLQEMNKRFERLEQQMQLILQKLDQK